MTCQREKSKQAKQKKWQNKREEGSEKDKEKDVYDCILVFYYLFLKLAPQEP